MLLLSMYYHFYPLTRFLFVVYILSILFKNLKHIIINLLILSRAGRLLVISEMSEISKYILFSGIFHYISLIF